MQAENVLNGIFPSIAYQVYINYNFMDTNIFYILISQKAINVHRHDTDQKKTVPPDAGSPKTVQAEQ